MKFTRIVQITDLHLLPTAEEKLHGIDSAASLQAVISHVKSLKVAPDLILATGDLAEDGGKSTYVRLAEMFSTLAVPVFVVPGNHDCVENMQSSLLSKTIKMERKTEIGGWIIGFVNSQVHEEVYGFVDADDLSALERTINTAGGKPCLLALHHSPTPECASSGCQLKNSQALLGVLEKYDNVKAVIAGHIHCEKERNHSGIKLLTTPSTFLHFTHHRSSESEDQEASGKAHSVDGNRRGYRVIDIFPDGNLNTEVYWL